ncbi:MAG: hypothetical protein SGJ17_12790 [Hyphomicrobiales bacterium]|nr:hypothetical protein [Hyphomicrobiales bacterium]
MATRTQILKLAARIDALSERINPARRLPITIMTWDGEDVAAAKRRHYARHPEDLGCDEIIITIRWMTPEEAAACGMV